jgi:hypothetical protein
MVLGSRITHSSAVVLVGLAAAVSVSGLLLYWYKYSAKVPVLADKKSDDDEEEEPKSSPVSESSNEGKPSDINLEQELHAKIEELDKQGKDRFKNKQVRVWVIVA